MQNLKRKYPILVLIAASLFFLYDIINDLIKGADSSLHLLLESGIFVATSLALFIEIRGVIGLHKKVSIEQEKVSRLSGELFTIINKEFDNWKLTETEREIALLMIKGCSMREIGDLRQVKEKTVRQQATQIYAKSGYSNRHELATHFIEDLINTPPNKN